MRALISQSNYIPWHGFFAMLRHVDTFVILDTVQFTRRDWRSRNRVVMQSEPRWLSIPVHGSQQLRINEVQVADAGWTERHLSVLSACYRDVMEDADWVWLAEIYSRAKGIDKLTEVNETFLREICCYLSIDTQILRAEAFQDHPDPSERLLDICRNLGASEYWTGPSARGYLRLAPFAEHEIDVRFFDLSAIQGIREHRGSPPYLPLSILHDIAQFGVSQTASRATYMDSDQ